MNYEHLPELPPDLKSLEADLVAMSPACGALSRDELMYRAGWEASAASTAGDPARAKVKSQAKTDRIRGSSWLWPLSTAGLLLVAAILGVILATRSPEVRVVYIEKPVRSSSEALPSKQPADKRPISSPDETVAAQHPQLPSAKIVNRIQFGAGHEYLSLRQRVLAFGVDVLRTRGAMPPRSDDPTASDSRYGTLLGQLRGG
jgi:hypothetical protein